MFIDLAVEVLIHIVTIGAGWMSAIFCVMMAYWPILKTSRVGSEESFATTDLPGFGWMILKDPVKRSTWNLCFAEYLLIQVLVAVGAIFACLHLWGGEISKEQSNARVVFLCLFVSGYVSSTLMSGWKFRPTDPTDKPTAK